MSVQIAEWLVIATVKTLGTDGIARKPWVVFVAAPVKTLGTDGTAKRSRRAALAAIQTKIRMMTRI
jgi:hypothetical protein